MEKKYAVVIVVILTFFLGIGCNRGSDVGSSVWQNLPTSSSGIGVTGILRGNVLDIYGNPVDKAFIELLTYATSTSPITTGITDNTGAFSISDVPVGTYLVKVSKGGYALSLQTVTINPEIVNPFTAVFDPDSGVLTGVVRSSAPPYALLATAQIRISSLTAPNNPITGQATATTGSDGTYRVNLSSGTYSLIASKDSFANSVPIQLTIQVNQTLTQDFALSPTVGVLAGIVLGIDGQPVNGARVDAISLANPPAPPQIAISGPSIGGATTEGGTTVAASAGTFQFTLAAGAYRIQATMNGRLADSTIATVSSPINPQVTLVLKPTPIIDGKVKYVSTSGYMDNDGVSVKATNIANGQTFSSFTYNGSYTIAVSTGTFSILFEKPGYFPVLKTGIVVGESGLTVDVVIMWSIPRLTGIVSAPGPLPGTSVATSGVNVHIRPDPDPGSPPIFDVTTDDIGAYSLEVPFIGKYKATFSKVGLTTLIQNVDIASSGATLSVALSAPAQASIPQVTGKVRDSAGAGLSGVAVRAVDTNGKTFSTLTDPVAIPVGSYSIAVSTGTYSLSFSKQGYLDVTKTGILVPESGATMEDIYMYPEPYLMGIVKALVNGVPVGQNDVLVEVLATRSGTLVPVIDGVTVTDPTTSIVGSYSLKVDSTGKYRVVFTKTGFSTLIKDDVEIASLGKTLNVTLGYLPLVSGVVLESDLATPLPDVTVSAVNQTTSLRTEATSGATGSFKLYLEPGIYDISYSLSGRIGTTTVQTVTANGLVLPNQVLYSPPVLSGIIWTPEISASDNMPTGNFIGIEALVRLKKNGVEIDSDISSGSTPTIITGKYLFTLDAAGTYDLEITKEGYIASSVSITVPVSGAIKDVTILPRPAIKGKILELDTTQTPATTKDLADVNVRAENALDPLKVFQTKTKSDGTYSLTVDPNADYNLSFTKDLYQTIPKTTGIQTPILIAVKTSNVNRDLTMYRLRLNGFIYETDGITGLPDCVIEASGTSEFVFSTRSGLTGTDKGKYGIDVPSPQFNVKFSKTGYKPLTVSNVLADGNMVLDVTLSQYSSVSGYVFDASGAVVISAGIGAEVFVLKDTGGGFTTVVKSVKSDSKGRYSVDLTSPGTYQFSLVCAGYTTLDADIAHQVIINNDAQLMNFIMIKRP
ncbi:MAG: carboxypeptidase regulatory-like domain-containing protein [Terrimicrobiaceae bacterium]